jgi:hypothetical protein
LIPVVGSIDCIGSGQTVPLLGSGQTVLLLGRNIYIVGVQKDALAFLRPLKHTINGFSTLFGMADSHSDINALQRIRYSLGLKKVML